MKIMKKTSVLLLTLCILFTTAVTPAMAKTIDIEIDPELIFSPVTTLGVFVDGAADAALTGNYPYGETAEITAPDVEGKVFQYWTNAEGAVISYEPELSLIIYASTNVSAVYGKSEPTVKTAAAFLNVTRTDTEIVFNAIVSSPSEITESGVRYSTTKKSLNDLKGETDVTVALASESPNWTLLVTPDDEDAVCCAVAFATVDGTTTYSAVKAVKLSELGSGVSMVINPGDIDLSEINAEFCVVTFDANGGVGAMEPQGVLAGEPAVLYANTFTRDGYTFTGWKTQTSGGTSYADGAEVTLDESVTLYAQWRSNSSGGSSSTQPAVTETATAADGSAVTKELDTSSTTKTNSDGSVTVTDKTTETITTTGENGSVETRTETVNAETTGSRKNADGSVTDTTKVSSTETVKETATDTNGSTTVTETKTEQSGSTAVTTKANADGGKTETTETTETVKVTEKVTDASGKATTTVTETTTETKTDMTIAADGKATGTSTTTTTVKDESGKVLSTAVTEAEITATTDANGTTTTETAATTTTTDADGKETVDKTFTTEYEAANGSTGTIVKDEDGEVLSQETAISQQEAEAARDEGRPAQSPLIVTPVPEEQADSTTPVQIRMPSLLYDRDNNGLVSAAEMPKVEIQVTYTRPGVIAMLRDALGRLYPIKECYEGSVIVPVTGSGEVVIVDNTKAFKDVEESRWFHEYVTFVTAREIFNGSGKGTFLPNDEMTRAMLTQVLYNFHRGAEAGNGAVFSDVPAGEWYNAAIGWAYENGVVNGYGDTFGANDSISRQDLATILYRYAKWAGYDVSKTASLDKFADAASVSSYAKEAMQWAVAEGLISGTTAGTLAPSGSATRAQVAAIMTRFVRSAK